MFNPKIPFKFLAFLPLRPGKEIWTKKPMPVSLETVNNVMEDLGISLYIEIPKEIYKSGGLTLYFNTLQCFHPDHIIKNNPYLKNQLNALEYSAAAKKKGLPDLEILKSLKTNFNLSIDINPLDIVQQTDNTKTNSSIDNILQMVSLPKQKPSQAKGIDQITLQIETNLKNLLIHIFSNEEFRKLEAVWQGIGLLLKQDKTDSGMLFEIVPIQFDDIEETFDSIMIHLIKDPPSCMIIDMPFENTPKHLSILEKIAQVSDTLLTPSICPIAPKFLFINDWKEVEKLPYLPNYLEEAYFAKFRRLKGLPSSRWLALTLNPFLVRYPYGPDNSPKIVKFTESNPLWISPVWGIASIIAKSLIQTGWPTRHMQWKDIRISDIALHQFQEGKALSTQIPISEDRLYEFSKSGFIPLMGFNNQSIAFSPSDVNLQGGSLSYQLFMSRITNLVLWCKDNFEINLTPDEVKERLYDVFSTYWEKTGYPGPEVLDISTTTPDAEGVFNIRINIRPSREILPAGGEVNLQFSWQAAQGA